MLLFPAGHLKFVVVNNIVVVLVKVDIPAEIVIHRGKPVSVSMSLLLPSPLKFPKKHLSGKYPVLRNSTK